MTTGTTGLNSVAFTINQTSGTVVITQQHNRYFAVREKGTNNFLPYIHKKRGNSFQIPCDANYHPMRLFKSAWAAKCALIAWLRGEHIRHLTSSVSSLDGPDCDEYVEVRFKPERKEENMEIVEVEVREVAIYPVRNK